MKRTLMALLLALPIYSMAYVPFQGEVTNDTTEATALENVFKGTIGNMKNYQPLSGVKLTVTSSDGELKKIVTTDSIGKFYLVGIPAGTYKVRFEKDGFEPGTYQSLNIQEGSSRSFGFLMFEE